MLGLKLNHVSKKGKKGALVDITYICEGDTTGNSIGRAQWKGIVCYWKGI